MAKRILFVITQSEFGGAQRFLDTLVTHLPQEEYEILIATGRDGDDKLISHLQKHNFKTKKLKFLVRSPHPYKDLMAVRELRHLIKNFRPDTLFLCSSKAGAIGSVAANLPSRIPNMKVIYRIGGWSFNDPWPQWKRQLWVMIEKRTARYKDMIIVNNQHDLDQAKQLDIKPRSSLELIHNGIDISEIDFLSRDEARNKLGLNTSDFVIGTIANFYPAKGLKHLVEATHLLKQKKTSQNWKVVIIGDGEGRAELEHQIKTLGLGEEVILVGRLDEARRYLKALDVYVLPSVKEGFPWAVLEAMGAGLPSVVTAVGSIPEVVTNNETGLIILPGKPNAIADKLKELISNEGLRTNLSIQAKIVAKNFSVIRMIEQIEKLL